MTDKTTGLRCQNGDACAAGQKACPSPKACGCAEVDERDTFQGDNAALSSCIRALLRLDAKGALYPHGIGGHARALLISADARIASLEAQHQQDLRAYDLTVQNLRAEIAAQPSRECLQQSAERLHAAATNAYAMLSSGMQIPDAQYRIVTELAAALQAVPPAPAGVKVAYDLSAVGIGEAPAFPKSLEDNFSTRVQSVIAAVLDPYHIEDGETRWHEKLAAELAAAVVNALPAGKMKDCAITPRRGCESPILISLDGTWDRMMVGDLDGYVIVAKERLNEVAPSPAQEHATQLAGQGQGGATYAALLDRAGLWIAHAQHGENCFLSDHYEGDPGAGCNCGKDALLDAIGPTLEAAPIQAQEDARDAVRALIATHAEMLEDNAYAYFELAYTRQTGWMAWITDKPFSGPVLNPDRKVLAKGQGDTPDEACADAARAAQGDAA